MNKSIISKGSFALNPIENFISLRQYLFMIEGEQKFLLLKLNNSRDEAVTAVTLQVTQKDYKGNALQPLTLNCTVENGNPRADFVLKQKIVLSNTCADFSVIVISANFGPYQYVPVNNELELRYQKADDPGRISYVPIKPNAARPSDVSVRKTKISVIFCILLMAVLASAMVFTYFHLQNFVANASEFTYSGVRYAFINGDKSTDSDVTVIGSKKNVKAIVIPENVLGHSVRSIQKDAFTDNVVLQKITVKAAIAIEDELFANNVYLTSVRLEKATQIGDYAFKNCYSLTEFSALNLKKIGESAFSDCHGLSTVQISNAQAVLKIGENAFYGCTSLKNVVIDQYIDYSERFNFLSQCYNLETLSLKNYNYSFVFDSKIYTDQKDNVIARLFGLDYNMGNKLNSLNSLTVEYSDSIPDNFCYGLPLSAVTVKKLTVGEVGKAAFYNCNKLSQFNVSKNITKVGDSAFYKTAIDAFNGKSLVSIGENAFENCEKLSKIDLSGNNALLSIGTAAFRRCYALERFTVPETVTDIKASTFEYCTGLTEIGLGAALLKIDDYAFYGCKKLTSVSVPQTVTLIGLGAFLECDSLKEIDLPFIGQTAGNNAYLAYIFGSTDAKNHTIPHTLEKVTVYNASVIGDNAFYNCSSIKQIDISGKFTRIGENAFYNCKSLSSFVLPDSVTQIGDGAFENCYKLYEVFNLSSLSIQPLTDGYGKVGYYALQVYNSLGQERMPSFSENGLVFGRSYQGKWYALNYTGNAGELSFPQNPNYNGSSIGSYEIVDYMIAENTVLTKVTLSSSVTAVGKYSFSSCTSLSSVVVPESVTTIGLGAFMNCSALKSATVPFIGNSATANRFLNYIFGSASAIDLNVVSSSLETLNVLNTTDVPDYAFYGFTKLKTVKLPNSYSRIGSFAFYNCANLTSFEFSVDLQSIAENAFTGCNMLTWVTVPKNVTTVGKGAFADCYNIAEMTLPFIGESASANRFLSHIFGASSSSNASVLPYSLKTIRLTGGTDIAANAFYNCNYLTTVVLPVGTESVGSKAFAYCNSLTAIDLPATVKTIGDNAFYNCEKLKVVTLNSMINVQENAFYNCKSLYEIYNLGGMTVTKGSTDNGYLAYYAMAIYNSANDAVIKEVTLDGIVYKYLEDYWAIVGYTGNATQLELSSFEFGGKTVSSYEIKTYAFRDNSYIQHLIVGKEVKSIAEFAFSGCINLETVLFNDASLTKLSNNVFSYCQSLLSVVLPQGLTSIGSYAFSSCNQLYSLVIPPFVTQIDNNAFDGCYSLYDVTNLSALSIRKGASDNGSVGYYAMRVSTSDSVAPLPTVLQNGCRFLLYNNLWYLISVPVNNGTILILPKSFAFDGNTIDSYILKECAFYNRNIDNVFIPLSVTKIENAMPSLKLSAVLYAGTVAQWAKLLSGVPNSELKKTPTTYNSKL